jgi:hypothetical protein
LGAGVAYEQRKRVNRPSCTSEVRAEAAVETDCRLNAAVAEHAPDHLVVSGIAPEDQGPGSMAELMNGQSKPSRFENGSIEACWPVGSKPRLAMSIMPYLGVRRSDAVLIGRKHESKDGLSVTFAQFKGRKRGIKLLTLPILPPLRAILDASTLGRESWLETVFGKSHSSNGFGNTFKDWCVEAGLPQCS